MTEKERIKIFEIKGVTAPPNVGRPDLDLGSKEDRKIVQKVFRREIQKHFEKNGFRTERKEWRLNLKAKCDSFGTLSFESSDCVRTYALLAPISDAVYEWKGNCKSLFSTMKKDKRQMFQGLIHGNQVGSKFSFAELLYQLDSFLVTADRKESCEIEEDDVPFR